MLTFYYFLANQGRLMVLILHPLLAKEHKYIDAPSLGSSPCRPAEYSRNTYLRTVAFKFDHVTSFGQ